MASKGVIVQIDFDTAYILRNNGSFITCPSHVNWNVGDVVTVSSGRHRIKIIILCTILLLSIGMGIGYIYRNNIESIKNNNIYPTDSEYTTTGSNNGQGNQYRHGHHRNDGYE